MENIKRFFNRITGRAAYTAQAEANRLAGRAHENAQWEKSHPSRINF